jgi:hypothetical protein
MLVVRVLALASRPLARSVLAFYWKNEEIKSNHDCPQFCTVCEHPTITGVFLKKS